jgi:hypothetical protein
MMMAKLVKSAFIIDLLNMSRVPSTFKQADLTKAVKAVVAAGVDIARVEIDAAGKIVIVAKSTEVTPVHELDRELAVWEARHGEG